MGTARQPAISADARASGAGARASDRRGWRYRSNVAARTLAATAGGYGVAGLSAAAGARWLPLPRIDAVMTATMLAFFVLPGVAIWAFLARSPGRAWAGILLAAATLAALIWLAPR